MQVYQSLHECCSYGLVGEAEKLVQEGKFTINSPDKDGNTPLHWASNGDHLHVIKVSASTAPPPPTPLHPCLLLTMMRKILLLFHSFLSLAFYFIPRTHIVQYLTSAGASPNHRGKDGQTPLHWAAIRGFVRSASELLGAGAAIDIRDDFGFSAFLRSVQSGHMGLANFLLASGASIENCDNEGHNAMHWAAYVQPPLPSLKNGNTLCQILWLHQHVRAAAPQGSPAAPLLGQRWFDALHDRMPFWLHQHRFVTGSWFLSRIYGLVLKLSAVNMLAGMGSRIDVRDHASLSGPDHLELHHKHLSYFASFHRKVAKFPLLGWCFPRNVCNPSTHETLKTILALGYVHWILYIIPLTMYLLWSHIMLAVASPFLWLGPLQSHISTRFGFRFTPILSLATMMLLPSC